jgi:hypothetical protein
MPLLLTRPERGGSILLENCIMTKQSKTQSDPRHVYCIRFMETACYKVTLTARNEKHAVALAKRRWYHGSHKNVFAFSSDTDGWDAELD